MKNIFKHRRINYLTSYYRANIGVAFKPGDWIKQLDFDVMAYAQSSFEHEMYVFVDVMKPIYKDGELAKSILRVDTHTFQVPVDVTLKSWNAGYPRAGLMVDMYINVPYERLTPLKNFLNGTTNKKTLVDDYFKHKHDYFRHNMDDKYKTFYEHLMHASMTQKDTYEWVKNTYTLLQKEEYKWIDDALERASKLPMFYKIIVSDKSVFNDQNNPFAQYVLKKKQKNIKCFSIRK